MDAPPNLTPHFHDEMAHLKARLLVMAGAAEEQVRDAMRALVDREAAPIRSAGKRMVTVVPTPSLLWTSIEPECISTSALVSGNPIPVPS